MARKEEGKRRGHFCWCCESVLPNERFSGRGRKKHICKKCQKLPETEREYRQIVRDMERLLTRYGHLPRRNRKRFAVYLEHENERVRRYAREFVLDADRDAALWRAELILENLDALCYAIGAARRTQAQEEADGDFRSADITGDYVWALERGADWMREELEELDRRFHGFGPAVASEPTDDDIPF